MFLSGQLCDSCVPCGPFEIIRPPRWYRGPRFLGSVVRGTPEKNVKYRRRVPANDKRSGGRELKPTTEKKNHIILMQYR